MSPLGVRRSPRLSWAHADSLAPAASLTGSSRKSVSLRSPLWRRTVDARSCARRTTRSCARRTDLSLFCSTVSTNGLTCAVAIIDTGIFAAGPAQAWHVSELPSPGSLQTPLTVDRTQSPSSLSSSSTSSRSWSPSTLVSSWSANYRAVNLASTRRRTTGSACPPSRRPSASA